MTTIAVIGLGYVGLPLAVEFGKRTPTIGFDLSADKVARIKQFDDPAGEISQEELRAATQLSVTTDGAKLAQADYILIAVPTPVDEAHRPDLSPLIGASEVAGKHMKRGAIVIYESTVYPGCTEDDCVPVLERASGRKWKQDFWIGYSPERINPGDREHILTNVVKVVAGDTRQSPTQSS